MSIVAKFMVTEKREITKGDKHPIYKLEAVDDDASGEMDHFARTTPKGSIKLRVDNPRAQSMLDIGREYYVEITPVKK
jgi:hypothetical protein